MSPSGSKLRASVSWESTPPSGCPASSDAAPAGRLGCRLQQRTLLDRASARLHSLTQSQADHLAREDMEAGPPTSTRVSASLKPRWQFRHAATWWLKQNVARTRRSSSLSLPPSSGAQDLLDRTRDGIGSTCGPVSDRYNGPKVHVARIDGLRRTRGLAPRNGLNCGISCPG